MPLNKPKHHAFISAVTFQEVELLRDHCKGVCKDCPWDKRCTRILTYGRAYQCFPKDWTNREIKQIYGRIKACNKAYNRKKYCAKRDCRIIIKETEK